MSSGRRGAELRLRREHLAPVPAEGAQRVRDRRDVDDLLRDSTPHRLQTTDRRDDHQYEAQPHAEHDALTRDAQRALAAGDGFRYAAEVVDRDHDICGRR